MVSTISWWFLAIVLCFGCAAIFTEFAFKLVNKWAPPDDKEATDAWQQ